MLIEKFLNYFDKTKHQILDNNRGNVITASQRSFTVHTIGFTCGTYLFRKNHFQAHICILGMM